MIDIENVVFSTVAQALRDEYAETYPQFKVYGEYVEFPESFPCVSLWMADNYSFPGSFELGNVDEHHSNVMFQTEIATVGEGRKALAKELADKVDELMTGMGFSRAAMMVLPNADPNAFRITLRHTGIASAWLSSETGDGNEATELLTSLIYR